MADFPNLRFAVGVFDAWDQLRDVLQGLQVDGFALDNFNCVALQRVFAGRIGVVTPSQEPVKVQELAFPDNAELIACTSGPVADLLSEKFRSGARSLKDALGSWLMPRHAAHLQQAVESGKIIIWIRLVDAAHERRVCQILLAQSSDTVSVYELTSRYNRSRRESSH